MAASAPVLLLGAAAGASLLGTGLAVVGGLQESAARAQAHRANAAIARQQAEFARQQAEQERQRAAIEAEIFAREARRRQGQRLSAIASSGVTLSGSALDILLDASLEDAQQRALIIHEGEQRARARLHGATIDEMQAAEFQRQAAAERRGAPLTAAATIIGGFGRTAFDVVNSPAFNRLVAGSSRVAGGRI